jgi:hypothetical protein
VAPVTTRTENNVSYTTLNSYKVFSCKTTAKKGEIREFFLENFVEKNLNGNFEINKQKLTLTRFSFVNALTYDRFYAIRCYVRAQITF